MADGAFARRVVGLNVSLSFLRYASSRMISSSMRLEKRYLNTHFPRLTTKVLAIDHTTVNRNFTPMFISELKFFIHDHFVSIYLSIKAVILFKDACESTCTCI